MVQLLTLLDTIFDDKLVPCHLIFLRTLHTVAKLLEWSFWTILAVVTLQTFYLGKHDLLTVYLGKLDFLSVTDFSPGNLPRENSIFWVLDMSRKQ